MFPDAYGTETFLDRAPAWVARWSGLRFGSGDPEALAEAGIAWWLSHGEDPTTKTLILSDRLDVEAIERLHARFSDRVRLGFVWGALFSHDFRGLHPDDALAPLSLVCKAIRANGRPTLKLSDSAGKTLGPVAEVARYQWVFAVRSAAERLIEV